MNETFNKLITIFLEKFMSYPKPGDETVINELRKIIEN